MSQDVVSYTAYTFYLTHVASHTQALELDGNCVAALGGRSETYRVMRCMDEALADALRVLELELNPVSAASYMALMVIGECYRLTGEYELAVQSYTKALEVRSPLHTHTKYNNYNNTYIHTYIHTYYNNRYVYVVTMMIRAGGADCYTKAL
jgi:tetratricopeptide (TPR) repeat protein